MTTNIADIRATLTARRAELQTRLQRVKADQGRQQEPLSPDAPDRAVQRGNDDVVDSISDSAHAELLKLDEALYRLDIGQYGKCEECGFPIEAARLAAVPYADRCQRCASDPEDRQASRSCCG